MTISDRYRNLPIKNKLRLVIILTLIASGVFACATVLAYDQIAAREAMRNDLDVLAEIFSANSTAALSFKDRPAAEELLSTLRAKRPIVTAYIYTADGKQFASYHRSADRAQFLPQAPEADGSRFENHRLILFKSITLQKSVPSHSSRTWKSSGRDWCASSRSLSPPWRAHPCWP